MLSRRNSRNLDYIISIVINLLYLNNCLFKSSKRWNANDLHCITNTICTTTINNLYSVNSTSSSKEYLNSCKFTSCRTSGSYQSCIIVFFGRTRIVTVTSTIINEAQFGNSIQSVIVLCFDDAISSSNAYSISGNDVSYTNSNAEIFAK